MFSSNITLNSHGVPLTDFSLRTEDLLSYIRITSTDFGYHLQITPPPKLCDWISDVPLKKWASEMAPFSSKYYNKCFIISCFLACKSSSAVPSFKKSLTTQSAALILSRFRKIFEALTFHDLFSDKKLGF